MTVPEILRENAGRWPEQSALVAVERGRDIRVSFGKLESAAAAFGRRLRAAGVGRGDVVLVFVPMSVGLYVTLLGILRIGAVAMFVDPSAGLGHIGACCRRQAPRAMVAGAAVRAARWLVRELRRIPVVMGPDAVREDGAKIGKPEEIATPSSHDAALITFTSGSTGQPKAAVRTHGFLVAQHAALREAIDLQPGEVDLTTLPIFVLANLASGVTSVLPNARMSRPGSVAVGRVADQIRRIGPQRSAGSPAFYLRMMQDGAALAGFEKVFTGGAPVFPAMLRKLQLAVGTGRVVAVYGSTEAEPIAHVGTDEISVGDWDAMATGAGLLAGTPVRQVRLKVIRDQWGTVVGDDGALGEGQVGEIVVTGNHVLKGYLGGEGDGETKFASKGEIWHRTGDAGYLDAAGRLWLLGRCAARVKDAAGVVYPFAVECVAMTFGWVRRAAFVGLDGRRVVAIEGVPPNGSALTELRQKLEWARVDEVRLLRRIPVDRRHNSKVSYPELLGMLRREDGGR